MSTKAERNSFRILVVDDNQDSAITLGMLLEAWGHEIKTCFNGYAAIDQAYDFKPDLILLDIRLPGLDGYQVARRLREDERVAAIKICAMTAYPEHQDTAKLKEAGFDFLVAKPVKPEVLQNVIMQL